MFLDKNQSGQRWCEIRDLWNEFDPIGVLPAQGGPHDEYDDYLGPSLRLLEQGKSQNEITRYLEQIVGEHMGMGKHGVEFVRASGFAAKLQGWYSSRWAGTHV